MPVFDWLIAPLSGAPDHHIAPWAYWHARCRVLAWGVLLPLGALLARFYKVTPHEDWPRTLHNRAWWDSPRALQWAGVLVMSLGVWLVWGHGQGPSPWARLHGWAGWALCAIPPLIFTFIAARQIITGLTAGAVKG